MFLLRARLQASLRSADASGVLASMIGDNLPSQCDECGVIEMSQPHGEARSRPVLAEDRLLGSRDKSEAAGEQLVSQ